MKIQPQNCFRWLKLGDEKILQIKHVVYQESYGPEEFWEDIPVVEEEIELKPCPWCKQTPEFRKSTSCQSYDDTGKRYDECVDLPQEVVECNNVHCACRPRICRVNTGDSITLWNMLGTDKIALRK